jgi:hypothetical protein
MTQYLLSVHMVDGEEVPPPEKMQQRFAAVDKFNAELQETGAWVFGGGLHPADTATVVRAEGDQVVTTDGPFADLDAALALAATGSAACGAPVEVRPFQND